MIRTEPIRIPFHYAAGEVASRFLVALRDEQRLLGSRCGGCGQVACPARSICPWCCEATAELLEVGPGATLVSWTETGAGARFGLVQLEGADGCMLHRLVGSHHEVGMELQAVFAHDRCGSIADIEGFAARRQS